MGEGTKQEVRRGALSGALLRLLGHRYRGIKLDANGVTLAGRKPRTVAFSDIVGPAQVTRATGFSAVVLPVRGQDQVKVAGIRRRDAADFVSAANDAWRKYFRTQIDAYEDELRALAEVVERLENPRRYPSACLLDPFLKRARDLLDRLPASIPEGVLPAAQQGLVDSLIRFGRAPEKLRADAITSF